MPGQFDPSALPRRPGAYFNFKAAQPDVLLPSVGAIVAVPFTHSWGPLSTPVALASFGEFGATFGNDTESPGYRAVRQAFTGEAVRDRRGAGVVLGYRMGGTGAAKASIALQNTTPAAALTVDALYEGIRGNNLKITIRTSVNDPTKKDFVVLDGLTEVESYLYDPAGIDSVATLANTVNGSSHWVHLSVLVDGVALAVVSSVPLTGGNDGSTLTATEWTAMMTAMEAQRFGYLAPFDLTDSAILASLKSWVQTVNAKGRRFFLIVGGATDEIITAATSRAKTLNDPDILTVGVGSVRDFNLTDAAGEPLVLSTSQLAPRIAGIMSALGETRSMTGARLGGLELLNGATESGIDQAFDNGVTVLSADSDAEAPVHIEKGLTSFTTATDPDRPVKIYREPKYVRTMHDLQTEITEYCQSMVIGQLPVNSKTRSAVVAEMSARMRVREESSAIQPGWSVQVSAQPPPTDDDDFIALDYLFGFGRSVEQVLNTIIVH
jgi:Phage tail sheath protein beta-sandwich domain